MLNVSDEFDPVRVFTAAVGGLGDIGGTGGTGGSGGSGGIGTLPQTGGNTITEEEVRLDNNNGDHERFSHYVRKEKIMESAVTGKPVKALCGKKWVPSRDPEKFPICPTCKEIYSKLPKE